MFTIALNCYHIQDLDLIYDLFLSDLGSCCICNNLSIAKVLFL